MVLLLIKRRFIYITASSKSATASFKIQYTNKPTNREPKIIIKVIEYFSVFTSQMKWHPVGNQASVHKESNVGPVHGDILISKMRPGHELDLHLVAVKGVGRDHAKFSPVGMFISLHYSLN